MSRTDLSNIPVHCVVCAQVLGEDRIRRKAVTCSAECQTTRTIYLRSRLDQKKCRYCMRPSTPAQRGLYFRWEGLQRRTASSAALPALIEHMPAVVEALKQAGATVDGAELTRLLTYVLDQGQGRERVRGRPKAEGSEPLVEVIEEEEHP